MEMLMKQQELLDLGEALQGARIVCYEGQCWVTQTGDDRDHIIRNGGIFMIRAKGRVIVTATDSCRISLAGGHKACIIQAPCKAAYNFIRNCLVNASGRTRLS